MIKVPTGTVPDIAGLREAIEKKNANPIPDKAANAVPRMYVQDATDSILLNKNIPQGNQNVNGISAPTEKAASGEAGESTAINTDPAEHTPEEQRIIEEYKKGYSEKLRAFVEKVRNLKNNDYKNKIREVIDTKTDKALVEAKRLTGVDTSGYSNIIKGNSVLHIDKRHGINGEADHSMSNIEDISRIGFVLDNFTNAEIIAEDNIDKDVAKLSSEWKNSDGTQAPLVRFSLPVNGTYYVVEAVPSSNAKVMAVVSAYMGKGHEKAPSIESLSLPETQTSSATPETRLDLLGANDNIPQNAPGVNGIVLPRAGEGDVLPRAGEVRANSGGEASATEYGILRSRSLPQNDSVGEGRLTQNDSMGETQTDGVEEARLPRNDSVTQNDNIGGKNNEQAVQRSGSGTERQAGDIHAGRDGGRDAYKGAGQQKGGMGKSGPQSAAEQVRAAARRQDIGGNLQKGKVSAAELGIKNGTDKANNTVLPREAWDEELESVAERIYRETGKEVTFVLGTMEIEKSDKSTGIIRGANTEKEIIIQADNIRVSVTQIADHEIFHEYADTNAGLINAVRKAIEKNFKREELDRTIQAYIQKLRGIADVVETPDGYEQNRRIYNILHEIFADAYAGINAFGANADKYGETVKTVLDERGVTDKRSRENAAATENKNAPNERYSISNISGEKGDYGLGVILDNNIFEGKSPRKWSEALKQYVYENMTGAKVEIYNEKGESETVQFARDNDRVKKDGANNSHKVIDKLARYKGDNIRALATVQLDEALITSTYEKSTDEHSHQWMDENGWEYRKTYLQDKAGNIYEATLNIAKGRDRRILYDINNIRQIDKRELPAASLPNSRFETQKDIQNERGSLTSHNSLNKSIPQNGEKSNTENGIVLSRAGERAVLPRAKDKNAPNRYSLNPDFASEIDAWDGRSEYTFEVGRTSDALKSIGIADRGIIWYGGKIAKILKKHSGMTLGVIKQVPKLLEEPIMILKSRQIESRVVVLGELNDLNGNTVTAILELQPMDKVGTLLDMNTITSAYGKSTNLDNFIKNSEILYIEPNENKTKHWLNGRGLQLPLFTTKLGSIGTVTYQDGKVKIEGVPYAQYMQNGGKDTATTGKNGIVLPRAGERAVLPRAKDNYGNGAKGKSRERYSFAEDGDIAAIQSIGRKSINDFTSDDIEATKAFAQKYWREMGTKSPFFRAWFGDWRANDKTKVRLANERGDARGVQRNEDTGWDINVSRKVFSETGAHKSQVAKSALPYLEYIDDIVKKAVLLDSYTMDRQKSDNSLIMHSLYAVADIGNGAEIIKLYVEEMNDPNSTDTAKRAYQIQNIEKVSAVKGGVQSNPLAPLAITTDTVKTIAHSTGDVNTKNVSAASVRVQGKTFSSLTNTANTITNIADLFAAVKLRDKNFNPKPASKVVDEEGRPLKVYHGTDSSFTIFDTGELSGLEGSFFFAQNREDAEAYTASGRIMEAYVNLQNPVDYNDMPSEVYKLRDKKAQVEALKKLGYDGWMCDMDTGWGEISAFYPEQIKSAVGNTGSFNRANRDIRYSVDETADMSTDSENGSKTKKKKEKKPIAESKPTIAKRDLRHSIISAFSIPDGRKAEMGAIIDTYADRLIKNGRLTQKDMDAFFDRMYAEGVMEVEAQEEYAELRKSVQGRRIYVPESIKAEFGDDWNEFRKKAFANRIYLTNDSADGHIDVINAELNEQLPWIFETDNYDGKLMLERLIQIAEEGKSEQMSLAEYTSLLAEQEFINEDEILDNMERQLDWALRTFAEKAELEIKLKDRTGIKIAEEREKLNERLRTEKLREGTRRAEERANRKEMRERERERRELREMQQKTLKQLQWLSKNRNRADNETKAVWDEVLGDIDIYAVNAADEMRWNKRYNMTWRDAADMYADAVANNDWLKYDKELARIADRVRKIHLGDEEFTIDRLRDLYKLVVGLRTEFYNHQNLVADERHRIFEEIYEDSCKEIKQAGKNKTLPRYADKIWNDFAGIPELTDRKNSSKLERRNQVFVLDSSLLERRT